MHAEPHTHNEAYTHAAYILYMKDSHMGLYVLDFIGLGLEYQELSQVQTEQHFSLL